jgi:hypothetical protein
MIQRATDIAASESGRALVSHKIISEAKNALVSNNMAKVLKILGERATDSDVAAALANIDLNDPVAVAKFARMNRPISTWDAIFQLKMETSLARPGTFMKKFTWDMMRLFITRPIQTIAEGAVDTIRSIASGKPRQQFIAEIKPEVAGLIDGATEGASRVAFLNKNLFESPDIPGSVVDIRQRGTIFRGKVGEQIGKFVPSMWLRYLTEQVKGMIYTSEVYRLAYRQGQIEVRAGKITPEEFADRVSQLKANPEDWMMEAGAKEARYSTLTDAMGKFGESLMAARNDVPGARYLAQFVRLPMRALNFAREWSPLGFADLLKQDPNPNAVIAKASIGTTTMASLYLLASSGYITGSGTFIPPGETKKLYAMGWKPHSILIGGKYVGTHFLGPLGFLCDAVAELSDAMKYNDKLLPEDEKRNAFVALPMAIASSILDKSWTSELFRFYEMIHQPVQKAEEWMARAVVKTSPAGIIFNPLVSAAAQSIDKTVREVKSQEPNQWLRLAQETLNNMKANIPWASKSLPARFDITGQEVKHEGGAISTIFSPTSYTAQKENPLMQEIINTKASFGASPKKIGRTELTFGQQQEEAQKAWGQFSTLAMPLLSRPFYQNQPPEKKREILEKLIAVAHSAARMNIIAKYRINPRPE